jgi:hypothetical protein
VLGTVVSIFVAAGAAAAIETDTVNSYARGLWWSISLITTTGFIGKPPRTEAGAGLSVILMVLGFVLLAMVSAALAALFVRDDEGPRDGREDAELKEILAVLREMQARLSAVEASVSHTKSSPHSGRVARDDDRATRTLRMRD